MRPLLIWRGFSRVEGQVDLELFCGGSAKNDFKKSLTEVEELFIISPLCCRRIERNGAAGIDL